MLVLQSLAEFWPIFGPVLAAGAVYGGIRADLRGMRASIERAHVRLDEHINMHWGKNG